MLHLKEPLGPDYDTHPDDALNIKNVLTKLGYRKRPKYGESRSPTQEMIEALKAFQRDVGEVADGIAKPGGPTEKALKAELTRRTGNHTNNPHAKNGFLKSERLEQEIDGNPDRGELGKGQDNSRPGSTDRDPGENTNSGSRPLFNPQTDRAKSDGTVSGIVRSKAEEQADVPSRQHGEEPSASNEAVPTSPREALRQIVVRAGTISEEQTLGSLQYFYERVKGGAAAEQAWLETLGLIDAGEAPVLDLGENNDLFIPVSRQGRPPRTRGALTPGHAARNAVNRLQVEHLVRQIQQIEPSFQYEVLGSLSTPRQYTEREIIDLNRTLGKVSYFQRLQEILRERDPTHQRVPFNFASPQQQYKQEAAIQGRIGKTPAGSSWGPEFYAPPFSWRPSTPPSRIAPAHRVKNALRNYQNEKFDVFNTALWMNRSDMRHILERHHPDYWNGTTRNVQTFLPRNMKIQDVRGVIREIIRQNESYLPLRGNAQIYQIAGRVNGFLYRVGFENGHVSQFYPLQDIIQ